MSCFRTQVGRRNGHFLPSRMVALGTQWVQAKHSLRALNGSKPNIVCGDRTTFFPALVSVPIALWMHRHKDLRRAFRIRTSTDRIWYIPPLPALLLIVRSYLQSFFDWIRCAFGSSRATYMYYPDITITVRITQKGHRLNEALYPLLPHNAIRPLT